MQKDWRRIPLRDAKITREWEVSADISCIADIYCLGPGDMPETVEVDLHVPIDCIWLEDDNSVSIGAPQWKLQEKEEQLSILFGAKLVGIQVLETNEGEYE